jgi:phospholipid/cholesterol/gamma-HCH transport system substrate-binding protein
MDGSKAELKVGLTVVIAIVVLVAALYWIRGVQLHADYQRITVWFPNVGALEVGDPVSVAGVRRGKVNHIRLAHGGVETDLLISRDVVLRSDAVFTVKNVGLMGERFIGVETGFSREPWPADSIPHGMYETGIPEMMGVMGRVTMEIRELISTIRATIGSEESLKRLVTVSENLERLSEQTASMVETQRSGVSQALEDLRIAAHGLRQIMEENDETVTQTAQRFDSAAVKLNLFADKLDTLSGDIRAVVKNVQSGEGSLARLMNDDQLIRRWESSASELDQLIADIRANPKKYLNITVRIF